MSFADLIARTDRAVHTHLGGVTVEYQPAVGVAVEVTAIFDEPYALVDPGQAGVEQVGPAIWLRRADLPVDPDDDEPTVTIHGNAYRVVERKTDGPDGGSIMLRLHRADV